MARLLSVNVGLPRDIEWSGRTVHTGIWKNPVRGRCRVGRLNLDGDGQGDLGGHGGEQRAAFVYQIELYRYWQEQLKRTDFVHGQFGENFTIEGLPDDAVCIGDSYQIGGALFEVTQPRVTCYRVGIRMNEPRMPALLTSSGRPGFYFRVLQEGEVGAGDEIAKVGEAEERMTVAEISALLYSPNHARDRLERALRIEALSPGWRSSFEVLLQSQTSAGSGNAGLAPAAAAHPVAPGFQPLEVTAIDQELADVLSLTMYSPDHQALPAALPGQNVVLHLPQTTGGTPLFRSYSLSGPLSTERYRISVKIELNAAAGTYLQEHVRVGDVLDVDPDAAWLKLTYTASGTPVDYRVRLVTTKPTYGGRRWWFLCPLARQDGGPPRRVAKLYLPPGGRYFGSREAYELTYTSCQESGKYDGLYRRLAAEIGTDAASIRSALKRL